MILLLELFTLVFLNFSGNEASICYLVTQPADQGGFECVLLNNSVGGCSVILPGGFRDKMDEPVDDSKCQYCGQNAECILQDHGEYSCSCVPGFAGDGYKCADINECLSIQCHGHATCKNSVGSYECACKQGFVGNGSTCSDVDECEEGHHQCDTNAVCVNTVGSYYCNCSEGYNGTGYKCSDIDECSLSNKCESSPDTKCVNTEGSYFCRCPKGYKLYTSSYTVTPTGIISHLYCKDVDECSKTNNDCSAIIHAICINTEGSYVCSCEDGYNRNIIIRPDDPNYERITCEDINECSQHDTADEWNECGAVVNGRCVNTDGSYRCECEDGYVKVENNNEGFYCEPDIDECAIDITQYHCLSTSHAVCINTIGSYRCECEVGYSKIEITTTAMISDYESTGFYCEDIDECQEGTYNCKEHSYCTNTVGSFQCDCYGSFDEPLLNCSACPGDIPDVYEISGSAYCFVTFLKTWDDSRALCKSLGAHLITIESEDENIAVYNEIVKSKLTTHWIGINDLVMNGLWVWSANGAAALFTNWAVHNPEAHNYSNSCGYIGENGHWGNTECDEAMPFICEFV